MTQRITTEDEFHIIEHRAGHRIEAIVADQTFCSVPMEAPRLTLTLSLSSSFAYSGALALSSNSDDDAP